ncbi:MAG: class I SAM-dependent methyltransferase [Candidatus Rokubacteria bacterium]|nr:class I SAM-dependent methyltransferase [Candidatus Rokubacteria bacterium]
MTAAARDVWASGDLYEPYVGRWSRLVAREFVEWLGIPAGGRWLDVGCGTGALLGEVLARANPALAVGVDRSAGYVAHARRRLHVARSAFAVADATALPLATAAVDVAVCALVLNFVRSPVAMLAEMRRATVAGGIVAVYVWDYAQDMQLMRRFWDAAVELDPAAAELDEARRFPMCQPEPLAELCEQAGLAVVDVRAIDVPTVFRDFDDYWTPFLGGQGPAPGYCMSLSEERRVALREHIRARLPFEPDGSIHLIARAWAAKAAVT